VPTYGSAWDVFALGTYAYVADYNGIQVVDSSNPNSPPIIGGVDTPGHGRDVALANLFGYRVACIADGGSGLQIVDVLDPASPQIVGGVETDGVAEAVAVEGTWAYLADSWNGLLVTRITNPASPEITGHVDLHHYATDVAVAYPCAYVITGAMRVVDVSN
jgi:hypothetical protein